MSATRNIGRGTLWAKLLAGAIGNRILAEAAVRSPVATGSRSSKLFLCYRREDTQDAAGRLYDALVQAYGDDAVFMDIDGVPLGVDFIEYVASEMAKCSAAIIMIGKSWLKVKDGRGGRRLDDPDDHVRAEIVAAFKQAIPVIPVVVQGASMPTADALPEDIRALARRNGAELTAKYWRTDVERLLRQLDELILPKG